MKLSNLLSDPVGLAKYLFILLAGMLDVLAIKAFMQINNDVSMDQAISYATNSFLLFVGAAVMLVCAFGINRQRKLFYQFSVAMLGLNIILTVFSQLGILEIIFIILNAANLYVMLAFSAEFFES